MSNQIEKMLLDAIYAQPYSLSVVCNQLLINIKKRGPTKWPYHSHTNESVMMAQEKMIVNRASDRR